MGPRDLDLSQSTSSEEHAELRLDGRAAEVVEVRAREGVSELFRIEVECVLDGAPAPREILGQRAEIVLRDGRGAERSVRGIVAEARRRVADTGDVAHTLVIRPAVCPFTLGRSCRTFRDLDAVGIAREVLAGAAVHWEAAPHATRAYTAQYREDDWSFVSRLFEEEGIHTWFDEGTLVVSDTSTAAPDLEGGATIVFADDAGEGVGADREVVNAIGPDVAAAPTRFSVGSFDPAHPALDVRGGAGEGALEVYDAPGGGLASPDACARRARVRLEAAGTARARHRGRTTSVRLCPGRVVEIAGHPEPSLGGRFFVVSVETTVRQRRRARAANAPAYTCAFTAIPAAMPFRPAMTTPAPRQGGLQSGVVCADPGVEIHPDAGAGIRVQMHWDRGGKKDAAAGTWMRVAQRRTAGSMLIPRAGWTVLAANEEGSLDAPTVLSRIHDGEHPPAYSLPADKTRVVFKTATSPGGGSFNEIRFEDRQGAEEMFLEASRDMKLLVQNDRSEAVGGDAEYVVGLSRTRTVGVDKAERVDGDQSVTVVANEKVTVAGDRDKAVTQDEDRTIGQSRKVTVGDGHQSSVGGDVLRNVGSTLIEQAAGSLFGTSGAVTAVAVGAAKVDATPRTIAVSTDKYAVQAVGGAKLEVTGKARTISAGTAYTENVGGALLHITPKSFADVAEQTLAYTALGALTGDATEVMVKAKDKLVVSCGGTSITVTPSTVEIKAPAVDQSEGVIVGVAPVVELP